MANPRNFKDLTSPVEQRIRAELDIIETRFNDDLELPDQLAEVAVIESERGTEVNPAAIRHVNDALFNLYLSIARIQGISIERAKTAANDIQERAGLKRSHCEAAD